MNKQTKRNRRNRPKNITKKYYGGLSKNTSKDDSQGIFDLVGSKLSNYTGKITSYAANKGLRLLGLQTIKDTESDESNNEVDEKMNEISDAASGVISDVTEVFDKGSAAIIGNINDVLQSPKIENSVSEAAEETAEITQNLLENFNEKLSTPELKEETKLAIENAAEIADITVDAMDEPINKAIDELNAAGTKAASGAVSGAIKVGTDALAAVPGFGAVVELGKIVNDSSKAIGQVAEAASDATTTAAKLVKETSDNIDESLDKLDEKKNEFNDKIDKIEKPLSELKKKGGAILDRTNKSIESFENPIENPIMKAGARKTRRKLFKRKGKSKRVRWAI